MDKKPRYIITPVKEDLKEKMVFIGGPRQVGKTTLSLDILKNGDIKHPAYLNWDDLKSKEIIKNGQFPTNEKTIILDEIHKFYNWRNLVKGFFDTKRNEHKFLITGSARLDYYRKGGDSLQGRYHYYRLHPFSLFEISKKPTFSDLEQLLKFGGFPEPFLINNLRHWKRWQRERLSRVIHEDLRDLENVKEISIIELLADTLPYRVGSPLSIASLARDLEVNFRTVARWLDILENLYFSFRIPPFGTPKIRAVKKEQKLYLWDWSKVNEPGFRFENLVASNLLKFCHFKEDYYGDNMELRFIRDTDSREIDFVVLKNKTPIFAVECKTGEKTLSKHIHYFNERTNIPKFYQVHLGKKDFLSSSNIRVMPFSKFSLEILKV